MARSSDKPTAAELAAGMAAPKAKAEPKAAPTRTASVAKEKPAKPKEQPKDTPLQVFITADEAEQFKRAAESEGRTISGQLRILIAKFLAQAGE